MEAYLIMIMVVIRSSTLFSPASLRALLARETRRRIQAQLAAQSATTEEQDGGKRKEKEQERKKSRRSRSTEIFAAHKKVLCVMQNDGSCPKPRTQDQKKKITKTAWTVPSEVSEGYTDRGRDYMPSTSFVILFPCSLPLL